MINGHFFKLLIHILGGGRYVPGNTSPMDTTGPRPNQDPFTGSGRYVPDAKPSSGRNTTNLDPFTGSGRYVPNGDNDQQKRPLSASQSTVNSNNEIISLCSFCISMFRIRQRYGIVNKLSSNTVCCHG